MTETAAITWRDFANNSSLSLQLAEDIGAQLSTAIEQRGIATLALSGGSTPKPLFEALAQLELDWANVVVLQVDERWVNADHKDSNAALIQQHLLQGAAADARFVSLKTPADDPFLAAAALNELLAPLAARLDAVVLGMGTDGHTASWFPEAEQLAAALDPTNPSLCLAVRPPHAPHDRMTLTLSAVLAANKLYLHIVGAEKLDVYQKALQAGSAEEYPIRAVLHSDNPPEVYYAHDN